VGFYVLRERKQAKRVTKARAQSVGAAFLTAMLHKKHKNKFSLSVDPQEMHESSTGFPQPGGVDGLTLVCCATLETS
jgi:hypothetical protein